MKVTLVPGRELSPDLVGAWVRLQDGNPALASPYFHPEFTRAIAAVHADVEVAVVEDGGRLAAFFPFHRRDGCVATPVGGIISDYQGLVCAPEFTCELGQLMKPCRLVALQFDHILASQPSFSGFHRHVELSPQIDLSEGYQSYPAARRASGSKQIKACAYLLRRLGREIGPVRFVAQAPPGPLLKDVLACKSRQYLATGKPDLFGIKAIRCGIERIHAAQVDGFAGMLSLLYAGSRLVAGHFGMRGRSAWHYWFPAYDPEMAKYSPGLILLLKMAEHAPSLGVRRIDLGLGMSLYKKRLMNASVSLAGGSVELSRWRSLKWRARRTLRSLWVSLPLRASVRDKINALRPKGWTEQRGG